MEAECLHFLIDEEIYLIEEPEKVIPFAFFHESKEKSELELLHKIIKACKLDSFEVFDHLNVEDVRPEKALVFSGNKRNYEILQAGDVRVVYSNPLSILVNSVEEKSKLWKVLQELTA